MRPDQFTTELNPRYGVPAEPRFKASLSPFVIPNPLVVPKTGLNGFGEPVPSEFGSIDVDTETNEVYVDREDRIEAFSPGTAAEPTYRTIPPFGVGKLENSYAIAVTKDHFVYTSNKGNEVLRFGPGDLFPNVHTFAAAGPRSGTKK